MEEIVKKYLTKGEGDDNICELSARTAVIKQKTSEFKKKVLDKLKRM